MAVFCILALPVVGSLRRALQRDQESTPAMPAAAIAGNPPASAATSESDR
jgi:hypothetical protein